MEPSNTGSIASNVGKANASICKQIPAAVADIAASKVDDANASTFNLKQVPVPDIEIDIVEPT